MRLAIKRVYDAPHSEDGTRILVDRLWPRGVSRESGRIDHWLKDLSPSNALRTQYHGATAGDDAAWAAFQTDYAAELARPEAAEALTQLRALIAAGPVTLLFAARDPDRNNAEALRLWLEAN